MTVDCSTLWPSAVLDPGAERMHWATLVGLALRGEPDEVITDIVSFKLPLLFLVRGAKLGDAVTHGLYHRPGYDDNFCFLQLDAEPVVFPGATHAYQRDSKLSPDANKDGRGDVGSVRPGRYVAVLKSGTEPEVVFHIVNPDGSVRLPCWRDFDHNGVLTPEEMQLSESLRTGAQVGADGTWADSILIHGGIEEPKDAKHHFSIGCFTCHRKHRTLMANAVRAAGGKMNVVLITAPKLVELLAEYREAKTDPAPPPESERVA